MGKLLATLACMTILATVLLSGCASQSPITVTISQPPTTVTKTELRTIPVPTTSQVTSTTTSQVTSTTTITAATTTTVTTTITSVVDAPTTVIVTPTQTTSISSAQININWGYTSSFEISTEGKVSTPAAGNIYLIVGLKYENRGYFIATLYPDTLYALVNNVRYDSISVPIENEMPDTVVLLDGTLITGKIVFEVPNVPSSVSLIDPTFYPNYHIQFNGPQ